MYKRQEVSAVSGDSGSEEVDSSGAALAEIRVSMMELDVYKRQDGDIRQDLELRRIGVGRA